MEKLQHFWSSNQNSIIAIVIAVVTLMLGFFIANKIKQFIKKRTQPNKESVLTGGFISQVISISIKLLSIVIALRVIGFTDLTSNILAGAVILTFIVGFAFKDIGENFLAGILLAYKSPFKINDIVETDGITGNVVNLFLRETQIKTFDGKDVFIPNGQIIKLPLYNYTIDGYLRYDFVIGLDYGTNIADAIKTILEAIATIDSVLLHDDKKAKVIVDEFTASTVNLRVFFWINTFIDSSKKYPSGIKTEVMVTVFNALVEKGFSMPSDIIEIKQYNQ